MPRPDGHINYTVSDLQRYHAGTMTDAEMHALEKAALEDPFLADALEGFASHNPGVEELAALRGRLPVSEKKRRKFPLLSRNFLYKAAAILVVGLGIVYLGSLLREKPDKEIILADKITENMPADSASSLPVPVDQSVGTTIQQERAKTSVSITKPAPDVKGEANESISDDIKAVQKDLADAVPSSGREETTTSGDKKYVISGKVVDTEGNPLTAAEVQVHEQKQVTTDREGNFSIVSDDSVLSASVAVAGYERVSKKLRNDSRQTVVMAPTPKNSATAPAIDQNALKKEKSGRVSLPRRSPIIELIQGSAPKDGKEVYERFLKDSLDSKLFPDSLQQPAEVLLSFNVNSEGHVEQVQVEKPLCRACDEEIIRLLYTGPIWTQSDRRTFILLKF